VNSWPALVSILRHRSHVVASVHTPLDDTEMIRFRDDLADQAAAPWCEGVIIDVAGLDVLDSFGFTSIRSIAEVARLRGALTVIAGIQPDVALAVARLGVGTGSVAPAADLDDLVICVTLPDRAGRARRHTHRELLKATGGLEQEYHSKKDDAFGTGGCRGLGARPDAVRCEAQRCVPCPPRHA
jgi:rsbT antagonist protein RsbS